MKKFLSITTIVIVICTMLCSCGKTSFYEGTEIPDFKNIIGREADDVGNLDSIHMVNYTYNCDKEDQNQLISRYKTLLISEYDFYEMDNNTGYSGSILNHSENKTIVIIMSTEDSISVAIPQSGTTMDAG